MIENILRTVFSTQWHVIVICSLLLLLSTEAGFRMGKRIAQIKDHASRAPMGGVQGAILGIMGLLLGFTFAMSSARYESRRELVVREATAINGAYLRAAFLAPERQRKVEDLLRGYVDVRLDFLSAADSAAIADVEQRSAKVQGELWNHAVALSHEPPNAYAPLFVNALSEMINVDAAQLAAFRSHIPGAVWLLLLSVALCGCYISGYAAGTTGIRTSLPNFVLPLLLGIVITLVAALHRPRGGLIQISPQPLLELKTAIQPRQS